MKWLKNIWNRVKAGVKKAWMAISALVLTVLGALGLYNKADSASPTITDRLSWVLPTEYVNGTPLPANEIGEILYVWGTQSGGPYEAGSGSVPGTSLGVDLTRPGDGVGTRCYKIAAKLREDLGGWQSDWSNEVCKTVLPRPKPPSNLRVE